MNSKTMNWFSALVLLLAVLAAALLWHLQCGGGGGAANSAAAKAGKGTAKPAATKRTSASSVAPVAAPTVQTPATPVVAEPPSASSAPAATVAHSSAVTASAVDVSQKVPLITALPKPQVVGTQKEIKIPPSRLEPELTGRRPDFLIPPGCTNLALGRPVTASDNEPIVGELAFITDGDKATDEGSYVELASGKQWVQLDLGQTGEIFALLIWHFHGQILVFHSVVVQVSNDPTFAKDVTTIYNSDYENALGFGAGKDRVYIENYQGKLIDVSGAKGRYVRLWSNGSTAFTQNRYIEVEVWGRPVK